MSYLLANAMIPVTDKIIKNLGYKTKIKKVCHCSSTEFLENMKKIQNTKRQISTFTHGLQKLIDSIIIKPDLMFVLEGNVIMDFDRDVFSQPDKQGRRWIPIRNHKKTNFLQEAINVRVVKLMNELNNTSEEPYEIVHDTLKYVKMFKDLNSEDKSEVIKFYIDRVTEITKKDIYKEIIKEILSDKSESGYNELIFNKFNVIGVYSLANARYLFNYDTAKDDVESYGFKYLGHILRTDFKNF